MRIQKATIIDIYKVHKTLDEWHQDVGLGKLTLKDYENLAGKLTDDRKSYFLILHGKHIVGMVWGSALDDHFMVEGKFIRRGFRGQMKFCRKLVEADLQMTQGFGTIRDVLPPGKLPKKGQKVFGTIVARG